MINKVIRKIKRNRILKVQMNEAGAERCGNDYGGFDVIRNALKQDASLIIYSFGIGEDLSFSNDVIKKLPTDVFAFDPTPRAIKFVENNELHNNKKFHFYPYGISSRDEKVRFYFPANPEYVSGSMVKRKGMIDVGIDVSMKRLSSIMKELNHKHINLIKMDIEGSEFEVVPDILNSNISFDELCIEVHDRFFKKGNKMLGKLITELNNKGYYIAAISKNKEEITFIRKLT